MNFFTWHTIQKDQISWVITIFLVIYLGKHLASLLGKLLNKLYEILILQNPAI